MIHCFPTTHIRRGSALMIMLWAIALLGLTVVGLANYLNQGLDEDVGRSREFRARQLAESGLAVALHPQVKKYDPLLRHEISKGERFEVNIRSEGSRININSLMNEASRPVLLNIFTTWELSLDDAEMLVDRLMDWVDANDLTRLSGMERDDYAALGQPQFPRNRPFESIEEMSLVAGMDLLNTVKPRWRDYFTVWSQGKIDVNDASAEMLALITGVEIEQTEQIVETRLGPDSELGTDDDLEFSDLDQVRVALAMGQLEFDPIAPLLATSDQYQRIESIGIVGGFRQRLSVIVQKGNQGGKVLAYLE